MPSSLPAIFILSLVISGCAALQALQSITSISLQLRLSKGGRGRLECKCLIWELTLWLSFSFALRLRELTQIFSLALCCGNKLNVKSYSQATSFVLLETSQGSLNLKSSVGCNHLSFTAFNIKPEKTPSEPQGLARSCREKLWLWGKGSWEMLEVAATSVLNHRIP